MGGGCIVWLIVLGFLVLVLSAMLIKLKYGTISDVDGPRPQNVSPN